MIVLPILAVKNYDASLKFYTDKLGFVSTLTMQGREGPNTFGFVNNGEVQIGLSQDSSDLTGRGNGVTLMLYPPAGFDIDSYYNQVKSAGIPITEELKTELWGDRLFSIKDLDGYYLTFCKTVAAMPSVAEIEAMMADQP
jgi:uncharacterized glyoxalase superfamily protein PhnB